MIPDLRPPPPDSSRALRRPIPEVMRLAVALGLRRSGFTLVGVVLLALTAVVAPAARPSTRSVTLFSIQGHGFGHGVGLSQWGAEYRAVAGESTSRILAFYYPRTTIGAIRPRQVRVLLARRPLVRIGSRSRFELVDATGAVRRLPAGHWAIGPAGRIVGRSVRFPLVVRPGTAPVQLGSTGYAGTLTLTLAGGQLQVVNTLGLEQYVAGVVSSECPGSWRPAALRAQAVASRSYAVANLHPDASFDLYPDDRSQNYHGLHEHLPGATAAALATRGEVLRYAGQVVGAFFTAANGGLTSVPDGLWGGDGAPYYAVRNDPFDARSPDTNWGPLVVTLDDVRRAFPQIPADVTSVDLERNAGQRVVAVTFHGADGSAVPVGGYDFQQRLHLRSTYFDLAPQA